MTWTLESYDGLVCDLDGVVYRGPAPVPHAVASLTGAGKLVVYATNNASRPPADVAHHLRSLGLSATDDDVVNSSQAAAWVLSDLVEAGAAVLCVGGEGVPLAVSGAGFRVVTEATPTVAAVVQGYGPDVRARDLAEAAYAVQQGALWVATNTDGTLPTDRGVAPGNGSLVAAVGRAVGREPDRVAGKPQTPIYELAAERVSAPIERLLAVGDRLDTDIAGANALGMDSLLVLTGVDDVASAVLAPPELRPTRVASDLRVLLDPAARETSGTLTEQIRRRWALLDEGAPTTEALAGLDALVPGPS